MRQKREHDFSITAFRVVQEATGQIEPKPTKTFDAKALGHLGGLKGGRARACNTHTRKAGRNSKEGSSG